MPRTRTPKPDAGDAVDSDVKVTRGKAGTLSTETRPARSQPNTGRATRGQGNGSGTKTESSGPKGTDFVTEVSSGDARRGLEAMRDALAMAMAVAEPAVIAQIAGRLQHVIEAIAALPEEVVERSLEDELVARREARIAASKSGARAAGDS